MSRKPRVALIGAGIGGLTAAIALRQRGIEVALYEQATELIELGAGLQVGPNAVKVYRALGLEAELRAIAGEPINSLTLNWTDSMPLARGKMRGGFASQFGAPYYTVHRGEMLRVVAAPVPDSSLSFGKRCVGVANAGGVAVARFADGSEIEADAIIGCDGIRSKVRESLFGAAAPRQTGMECWRATVPAEEITNRVIAHGETFSIDDSVNWLGPVGRVVCYPICAGRVFNIFCGHVSGRWAEESWTVPSSLDEVLEAYRGYHETLVGMFHQVEKNAWFKWGVFDRDPLPRWTTGRVTLLGDAAHPMLPTLAQGAAMAIEDGYVLARCLAEQDDVDAALRSYEEARRDFTARTQLQARDQFELNQAVPPKPRASRDWLFAHDVTQAGAQPRETAGVAYDTAKEV
jgi:salicylate hydroxylase